MGWAVHFCQAAFVFKAERYSPKEGTLLRRINGAISRFTALKVEHWCYRPKRTTLLAAGLFLLGLAAYRFMPVAPIPRVDFPMIQVFASLPGADPATVASSVAAPLERRRAPKVTVTRERVSLCQN